jgi:hypothetical protein
MQLDVQDWSITQVVVTAVGLGFLSGLVVCAAAAYLPDVEERWRDRLIHHSAR